jgi:hypothetical protein
MHSNQVSAGPLPVDTQFRKLRKSNKIEHRAQNSCQATPALQGTPVQRMTALAIKSILPKGKQSACISHQMSAAGDTQLRKIKYRKTLERLAQNSCKVTPALRAGMATLVVKSIATKHRQSACIRSDFEISKT